MEDIFKEVQTSGSVEAGRHFDKNARRFRLNRRRIKLALLAFYAIAIPAFIVIGLQPAYTSAEVKAQESATAEEFLTIRSINLETPVSRVYLKNNTLDAPQYIAGYYRSYENKLLLIGHSLTVFENLKDIKIGDKIDFADGTYVVKNLETKEKSAIDMSEILKNEDVPTMILMTCAGEQLSGVDFSHRLIVTAKKL